MEKVAQMKSVLFSNSTGTTATQSRSDHMVGKDTWREDLVRETHRHDSCQILFVKRKQPKTKVKSQAAPCI